MVTPSPLPSPLPTVPVHVVDGASRLEVASTVVGVAGVLLAIYFAIRGSQQVRKERRMQHDLDVLRDVAEIAGPAQGNPTERARMHAALLTLLDRDACPMLRSWADAYPTDAGRQRYVAHLDDWYGKNPTLRRGSADWEAVRAVWEREVEDAMRARLDA